MNKAEKLFYVIMTSDMKNGIEPINIAFTEIAEEQRKADSDRARDEFIRMERMFIFINDESISARDMEMAVLKTPLVTEKK